MLIKQSFIPMACVAFILTGCGIPVIMGSEAGTVVATRPDAPPPANTQDQIPEHESWCYQTMGDTQCFAHIQDVPPDRLVNVDPASRYPVDSSRYHDVLIGPPPVRISEAPPEPPVLLPETIVQQPLKDVKPAAPAKKKPVVKKHKKPKPKPIKPVPNPPEMNRP